MPARPTLPRLAAIALLVSALLHVAALLAGSGGSVVVVLAASAVLVALAAGLLKGLRWVAWAGFFIALADGIAALGSAVAAAGGPDPICLAVAGCDWLAALALFIHLWRTPQRRADGV